MCEKILLIEKDAKMAEKQTAVWTSKGVRTERTDSMINGIKKLSSDNYLFIGINDDNIDCLPLLRTMRSVTRTPIFIGTGRFTTQSEVAALDNGANLYARWHMSPEDNMASVLAHLSNMSTRKTPLHKIMAYKDILLSPIQHIVYVGDKRIKLTRLEYDLLRYFMENRDIVLSYEQLCDNVWRDEYADAAPGVVKNAIKRVRRKISGGDKDRNLIENVWGVGFKFSAVSNSINQ